MADVYLNVVSGNGSAHTDALPPMVDGEQFTIYFSPDPGEELLSVRAYDSHDYSVALPPVSNNELTMRFRTGWGNLYVDIYFSGGDPPPGPGPSPGDLPLWLLYINNKWWRKNKYN